LEGSSGGSASLDLTRDPFSGDLMVRDKGTLHERTSVEEFKGGLCIIGRAAENNLSEIDVLIVNLIASYREILAKSLMLIFEGAGYKNSLPSKKKIVDVISRTESFVISKGGVLKGERSSLGGIREGLFPITDSKCEKVWL